MEEIKLKSELRDPLYKSFDILYDKCLEKVQSKADIQDVRKKVLQYFEQTLSEIISEKTGSNYIPSELSKLHRVFRSRDSLFEFPQQIIWENVKDEYRKRNMISKFSPKDHILEFEDFYYKLFIDYATKVYDKPILFDNFASSKERMDNLKEAKELVDKAVTETLSHCVKWDIIYSHQREGESKRRDEPKRRDESEYGRNDQPRRNDPPRRNDLPRESDKRQRSDEEETPILQIQSETKVKRSEDDGITRKLMLEKLEHEKYRRATDAKLSEIGKDYGDLKQKLSNTLRKLEFEQLNSQKERDDANQKFQKQQLEHQELMNILKEVQLKNKSLVEENKHLKGEKQPLKVEVDDIDEKESELIDEIIKEEEPKKENPKKEVKIDEHPDELESAKSKLPREDLHDM